jgi:glycerate kinase
MQTGNRRKYVIAFDSMKGCLSSEEAGQAVAEAIKQADGGAETVMLTVSDGGEGMLRAFTKAVGGNIERAYVHDPMMRRVWAEYGVTPDGTAIIEAAQACGLTLVSEEERNPMRATTYGTGELVAAAIDRGCRRFIVGLGGSGTSDAGIGMLRALTDRLATRGGTIDDALKGPLGHCRFTLACDVDNPLCGDNGAAMVFARQKGATPEMLPQLEQRAQRFARASALHFGFDRSSRPGAGAAGGLGYAFMQYLDAETCPGAELMLDICGFDAAIDGATCVITGEGHADRQTLMGKLPVSVMRRAGRKGLPAWLLAGSVDDKEELIKAGFAKVENITPGGMILAEAMKKEVATKNIRSLVATLME